MIQEDKRRLFSDEATLHLKEFHGALLEIEQKPEARDAIERLANVVRALRESSVRFGFPRVCAFSQVVETVLEKMRHDQLKVGAVQLKFLKKARDHLAELLVVVEVTQVQASTKPGVEARRQRDSGSQPSWVFAWDATAPVDNSDPLALLRFLKQPSLRRRESLNPFRSSHRADGRGVTRMTVSIAAPTPRVNRTIVPASCLPVAARCATRLRAEAMTKLCPTPKGANHVARSRAGSR